MAMGDKIKNAAEQAAGKAKEAAGKVTGNEDLETRGQADQASADAKQAGEKVKPPRKTGSASPPRARRTDPGKGT